MSLGSLLRGLVLGTVALAPLAYGCADTYGESNAPPQGALYFPSSITVLPPVAGEAQPRYALVLNSNFDLRFSAGWLSLVDLTKLEGATKPADAVVQQVKLPNFGGPIAIEDGGPLAEGDTRLAMIAHRGSSLISVVEVTVTDGVPRLSCGDPQATAGLGTLERRTDCDRPHLYDLSNDDLAFDGSADEVDAADLKDPYGTAAYTDPVDGSRHLAVSFLGHGPGTSAEILTFQIDHAAPGFLVPEHAVKPGMSGLGAMAVQPRLATCDPSAPETCPVRIAVGNRTYSSVDGSAVVLLTIDHGSVRASQHTFSTDVAGNQLSDVTFDATGEHAYVLSDTPDTLLGLDTSPYVMMPPGGSPTEELTFAIVDAMSVAGGASSLAYVPRPDEDLLAVTRFSDNDVMLVAVAGAALVPVADLRAVGSGPYAVAGMHEQSGSDLVLVPTFYDHGLTAIRVPEGDPAAASIVARVRSSELGDASKE